MLDKLRENPRVVVATLIIAGVIALFAGNGGDTNDTANIDQNEDTATTQVEDTSVDAKTEDDKDVIGSEPQAGPVVVEKNEEKYRGVVREGDNQTVIVRQIVNDFLGNQSQSLSAEQRLYVETTVVDTLPRNDLVFIGDEISVDETVLAKAVSDSGNLTQAQIAMWATYL